MFLDQANHAGTVVNENRPVKIRLDCVKHGSIKLPLKMAGETQSSHRRVGQFLIPISGRRIIHFNALAVHDNIDDPRYGDFFGNYRHHSRVDFDVLF